MRLQLATLLHHRRCCVCAKPLTAGEPGRPLGRGRYLVLRDLLEGVHGPRERAHTPCLEALGLAQLHGRQRRWDDPALRAAVLDLALRDGLRAAADQPGPTAAALPLLRLTPRGREALLRALRDVATPDPFREALERHGGALRPALAELIGRCPMLAALASAGVPTTTGPPAAAALLRGWVRTAVAVLQPAELARHGAALATLAPTTAGLRAFLRPGDLARWGRTVDLQAAHGAPVDLRGALVYCVPRDHAPHAIAWLLGLRVDPGPGCTTAFAVLARELVGADRLLPPAGRAERLPPAVRQLLAVVHACPGTFQGLVAAQPGAGPPKGLPAGVLLRAHEAVMPLLCWVHPGAGGSLTHAVRCAAAALVPDSATALLHATA